MANERSALVLGATGGFGGEVARQLVDAGWQVRALTRGAAPAQRGTGIEWLRGDALDRQAVMQAARGCAVIVHAVNPPKYHRWGELVLPMFDNTLAAARAEGATVVVPGNVYNYGPDAFPVLRESSPQRPLTRKGAIRVELERRLEQASTQGARGLVLRAGDFFGPGALSSWFAGCLVRPGKAVTVIREPGRAGAGHQWNYLPDLGRTLLALLERRAALGSYAVFHAGGHFDPDGRQMALAIQRVVQRQTGREPRIASFPWALTTPLAPFVEMIREMREMRYLWRETIRLDNARLEALIGAEPHTPLDEAVRATLVSLKCLPDAAADGAPGRAEERAGFESRSAEPRL